MFCGLRMRAPGARRTGLPLSLASGGAVVGVGSGLYAFLHRRSHPEIPENIVENAARQQRRATANARIMQRNGARIDATKIIVRPLGQ